MIKNLKELLSSKDEDHVKQGIELILTLGMEEELYLGFKDLLNDSDLSAIRPRSKFSSLFQCGADSSDLAQACLLALIKVLNESTHLTHHLTLNSTWNSNPYFDEFDLLHGGWEGVESLEFNGVKWQQIKHILEENPQVKTLKVMNTSIDWSECIEVFSKVNCLSLNYLEIEAFFNEDQYDILLPLLEKGVEGMEVYKMEELEDLLKVKRIDLGEEKDRWLAVLSHTVLGVSPKVKGIPFNMIYFPAGDFWMGTDHKELYSEESEQPRHKVKLSRGFWMGQTQVTQELWEAVTGENPSEFEGVTLPVDTVSWFDCVRFCNQLSELEGLVPAYSIGDGDKPDVEWNKEATGYRLPFEHEWEYSAKAGTEWIYAGSDHLEEVGWCVDDLNGQSKPVGQKKANTWGLYDMSGNCSEWCNDPWNRYTYKNRTGVTTDPYIYHQPEFVFRVCRGGNWLSTDDQCRVASRDDRNYPEFSWSTFSLRLLRPMQ